MTLYTPRRRQLTNRKVYRKKPGPVAVYSPTEAEERNRSAHEKYAASEKGKRTKLKAALKRYYGITLEEYDAMSNKQGGHCALCDRTDLHVDHCHTTGKFRGLLCRPHNVAIGTLGDDEAGLFKALVYVRGARA